MTAVTTGSDRDHERWRSGRDAGPEWPRPGVRGARGGGAGRRFLAVLLGVVLLAVSCSGGGDDGPAAAAADGDDPSSGADPADDGDDPGGEASAAAPVERTAPVDAVVLASSLAPFSMDPHASTSQSDISYLAMVYDRLLGMSNSLEVVPMVATEWAYVEDGTVFELTLREGISFEDGTPLDAAAVVANIDHARSVADGLAGKSLAGVERAEAVDATHVRLHLLPGASNLERMLSGPAGFLVSPAALDAGVDLQAGDTTAGSGPFHLVSWEPGEEAVYRPVEGYWDPERQGRSEMHLVFQPSDQARLDGLRSGAYDVASVQGDLVDEAIAVGAEGTFRYLTQNQNSIYGLFLNPNSPNVGDLELRQAIMEAVDRNDVVDGLMGGTCESRVQPFPLGSPYYFPELERRFSYDPDQARQLIADSGVADPTFEVYVPEGMYGELAARIQPHLAAVGITMDIKEVDLQTAAGAWTSGEADAAYLAMPAFADPGILIGGLYLQLPAWKDLSTQAAGADLARLQAVAPGSPVDPAIYQDILAALNEQALFVPGCSITTVWLWAPGIHGVDLMPNLWSGVVLPYTVGRGER